MSMGDKNKNPKGKNIQNAGKNIFMISKKKGGVKSG